MTQEAVVNSLSDQACYKALAELGVDVWLPNDWSLPEEVVTVSTVADTVEGPVETVGGNSGSSRAERHMTAKTALLETLQESGRGAKSVSLDVDSRTQLPISVSSAQPTETAQSTTSTSTSSTSTEASPKAAADTAVRYSLLLQPVSAHVLMLCELDDPDAPSLSAEENQLLLGVLSAVSTRLMSGEPIVQSGNIFRWPVSAEASRSTLFSDPLFAYKALEGLLSGQARRGVTEFIILGNQLSDLNLEIESGRLHHCPSLAAMSSGDRAAKGKLWTLLQTLLK